MCTIAPALLLDLVSAVQNRHPGVALQILDAAAPSLRDRLLDGDLEVAIYALPEVPQDDRLHYLSLFREQFMIVMHPQHRLAAQSEVKVRDLDGERYLSRVHCEYGGPADRIFDEQRVDCATVYESERDDWILAMAAAGLGIGFMPQHCVNHPGCQSHGRWWRRNSGVMLPWLHSAWSAAFAGSWKHWWPKRCGGGNGSSDPALAVQAMFTPATEDEPELSPSREHRLRRVGLNLLSQKKNNPRQCGG